MLAILLTKGTSYACNDNIKGNLIWMQSQFQRELNILAISNPKRTIYTCNIFQNGPHACNAGNGP